MRRAKFKSLLYILILFRFYGGRYIGRVFCSSEKAGLSRGERFRYQRLVSEAPPPHTAVFATLTSGEVSYGGGERGVPEPCHFCRCVKESGLGEAGAGV